MDTRTVREFHPHDYQLTSRQFLLNTTVGQGVSGGGALFLDPGMGKTAIVLDTFQLLKKIWGFRHALIVAPLRVCYKVWPTEIAHWSNFNDLTYSIIHSTGGGASARKKRLAMPTDFHIINREGVSWLADYCAARKGRLPWDLLIVDESTQYKNWSASCSKAMRQLSQRIPYRVIMTGTPAPKQLEDLFSQIWILDHGKALGKNITEFRDRYCAMEGWGKTSRFYVKWPARELIQQAVAPLCLRLDAKDYLTMPELVVHDVEVDLPAPAMAQYQLLEDAMFVQLAAEKKVIGQAAALYGACRQVASGGIYNMAGEAHTIHNALDDAVIELLDELGGKPCLIAYQYDHDLQRLRKRIKGLHAIKGGMSNVEFAKIIDGWNANTLDPPYVAVQPQALSYGVNMQHGEGRDIIWYGPTDNLDHYIQFNARVYRQGVTSTVRVHRLRAAGTIHDMIWDRTDEKSDVQSDLLTYLRGYAQQKGHVV